MKKETNMRYSYFYLLYPVTKQNLTKNKIKNEKFYFPPLKKAKAPTKGAFKYVAGSD